MSSPHPADFVCIDTVLDVKRLERQNWGQTDDRISAPRRQDAAISASLPQSPAASVYLWQVSEHAKREPKAPQNVAITGLKRFADIAGRNKALRSRALPSRDRLGLPRTDEPLLRSRGVTPAYAANCRADSNKLQSTISARSIAAVCSPIPGIDTNNSRCAFKPGCWSKWSRICWRIFSMSCSR